MIPFLTTDVKRYANAVFKQVAADQIGPGQANVHFGDLLTHYLRTSRILLTTSGTMALQLALHAAAIKQRRTGVALVPAYGFVATANAAELAGYKVRFVDVDETGCMTYDTLVDALNAHGDVSVVIFVNFAGNTPEYLPKIRQLCDDHAVVLIEDAACGIGHFAVGKHAGTFGHFGTLSFAPTKFVTTGQGGAVICEDIVDHQYLSEYINQGDSKRTGLVKVVGGNYRMSDLQAALGVAQMRRFPEILDQRYQQLRQFGNSPLLLRCSSGPVLYNLLKVPPAKSQAAMRILHDFGVHAVCQYKALYDSPLYRDHDAHNTFNGAETWKKGGIFLSHGLGLSVKDIQTISGAVHRIEEYVL